MHSLAMAQDILEAALIEAKRRDAKHVRAISVRIGDEHFTDSDSPQFCLEAAAKGTIAEEARIEVDLVERTAECLECAFVFPVDHHLPICPRCGNRNPEMLTVEEPIKIELELE